MRPGHAPRRSSSRLRSPQPHLPYDTVALACRAELHIALEGSELLALDLVDDGAHEAFFGAEVIDQHAVAGADGGGKLTQAAIVEAVSGDEGDGGGEESIAGVGAPARLGRRLYHMVR